MAEPLDRTVALSGDHSTLLITSEYDDRIRVIIRGVSGARWDRERRAWMVPTEHVNAVLEQLAPLDFTVAAEVSAMSEVTPVLEADPTLTVSQLNHRIRAALGSAFPESVWVRGELFSFDRTVSRRHWYFELTEKSSQTDDVAARLSAVIFAKSRRTIQQRLARSGEELTLRDGLEVRLRGRLDYYPPSGRTQLIVDDIDPDFSLGQLALRRQEILRALSDEGLLARNERLPWPSLPLRVGLITARGSDAYHDFVRTLTDSCYAFQVFHHPASVQGANVEKEVLGALEYFETRSETIDVVAIVRGGGSRSDLAWFDSLALARRVASSPIKVVIGIGHERDRSVLDDVAASEKTPTAAAARLASLVSNTADDVATLTKALVELTRRRLEQEWNRVGRVTSFLGRDSNTVLQRARYRLDHQLGPMILALARARLRLESARQAGITARLGHERILSRLRQPRERCRVNADRLRRTVKASLVEHDRRLASLDVRISACDPIRTLARGYAILRRDGTTVKKLGDAPVGSTVDVVLLDGTLQATVNEHLRKSET